MKMITKKFNSRAPIRHTISRGLLPLVMFAVGTASLTLAPPARADMFTPSAGDQIQLGNQEDAKIEQQYHVVHDARASHVVQVGNRLLQGLGRDRGPWQWTFHLIESKEVNAFALPGGNVYMFTGLTDRLTNDSELAAVIGHEMTHVRAQHWAHQYASSQKRQLGLMVFLGLVHANNTVRSLVGVGDQLLSLRYSRDEEEQADLGGLQNMVHAGYNPNGMLQLFQVLQKAEGSGGAPEFLSDHPLTSHRVTVARATIKRMGYSVQ